MYKKKKVTNIEDINFFVENKLLCIYEIYIFESFSCRGNHFISGQRSSEYSTLRGTGARNTYGSRLAHILSFPSNWAKIATQSSTGNVSSAGHLIFGKFLPLLSISLCFQFSNHWNVAITPPAAVLLFGKLLPLTLLCSLLHLLSDYVKYYFICLFC